MSKNYPRLALSAIASIIFIAIGTHARAQPIEYVRVCDAYGAGFYYIPGSDTCLKLGGYARESADLSHMMTGANMQFLGYVGSHSVHSFGSDYDATVFFGKASFGFRLPNYFRLQADAQMEMTDGYCAGCGSASYFAGILHLNWNPVSNIDFGLFGGAADVSPTFFAPRSTIGLYGVEARYFTNNWMVGGQIGMFDVSSGTGAGILTDAWFIEGRVQYSFGAFSPQLRGLGIRGTYGYASGKVAGGTISGESTQWSVGLSYRFTSTLSTFIGYHASENRVQTVGPVWRENTIKAGVKLDLGDPAAAVPIEPMVPTPSVLSVMHKF